MTYKLNIDQEERLRRLLHELQHEITQVEKLMVGDCRRLKSRQAEQDLRPLEYGEVRVTSELIEKRLAQHRDLLLVLQRRYLKTRQELDQVNEARLLQQAMEL